MILKIKLFTWKLIRDKILTKGYLRNIGMDINGDSPFSQNHLEDIDIFFSDVALSRRFEIHSLNIVLSLLEVILVSLTWLSVLGSTKMYITKYFIDLWKKSLLLRDLYG